jgi:hypothetical protein
MKKLRRGSVERISNEEAIQPDTVGCRRVLSYQRLRPKEEWSPLGRQDGFDPAS